MSEEQERQAIDASFDLGSRPVPAKVPVGLRLQYDVKFRKRAIVVGSALFAISTVLMVALSQTFGPKRSPEVGRDQLVQLAFGNEMQAKRNFEKAIMQWDYTAQPTNTGLMQRSLMNLTTEKRKAIKSQLKNPEHPCYQAPVRDVDYCAARAIATNTVSGEMMAAKTGTQFVLAVKDTKGKLVERRSLSENEMMVLSLGNWVALNNAGYEASWDFDLDPSDINALYFGQLSARGDRLKLENNTDPVATMQMIQQAWGGKK